MSTPAHLSSAAIAGGDAVQAPPLSRWAKPWNSWITVSRFRMLTSAARISPISRSKPGSRSCDHGSLIMASPARNSARSFTFRLAETKKPPAWTAAGGISSDPGAGGLALTFAQAARLPLLAELLELAGELFELVVEGQDDL